MISFSWHLIYNNNFCLQSKFDAIWHKFTSPKLIHISCYKIVIRVMTRTKIYFSRILRTLKFSPNKKIEPCPWVYYNL
jgi:hypothetical protein